MSHFSKLLSNTYTQKCFKSNSKLETLNTLTKEVQIFTFFNIPITKIFGKKFSQIDFYDAFCAIHCNLNDFHFRFIAHKTKKHKTEVGNDSVQKDMSYFFANATRCMP